MEMSPEEIAQATSGPLQFALRWIVSAGRDRAAEVWPLMTPEFRLAMTQGWLLSNPQALQHPSVAGRSRDELAHLLAVEHPQHPLYTPLARVSLRDIRNSYDNMNVEDLAPGTRPRPVGADLELVRLMYAPDLHRDERGNLLFLPGATARGASVLVRRGAGAWAVAGVGSGLLHPGWPPRWEQIVNPED